jgi:Cu(I)-responsive transcriptional regulator
MARPMNIGQAADAAGVSAKMVRHYEQIGLMPEAARTDAGYRQYTERDVSVLRFIRQARRLGFSTDQIGELLGLWSDDHRASREVKAVAQAHLSALEERMREMAQMQQALQRLVASCHGDDDPQCAILDELAVASPESPPPGAVGAKPVRKAARSGAAAPPAPASSHADPMAWKRSVRREQDRH